MKKIFASAFILLIVMSLFSCTESEEIIPTNLDEIQLQSENDPAFSDTYGGDVESNEYTQGESEGD